MKFLLMGTSLGVELFNSNKSLLFKDCLDY